MYRLRPQLSYANVMATLAVFIALGGASYAATQLPKNSVGPKQLKKNAVTAAKLRNGAVNGAKLGDGAVAASKLADSSVTSPKLSEGSVTAAKLATGAVSGEKVADDSLTGRQVRASTLGTVPRAERADSLSPPEAWHFVGAPGEPPFLNGWTNPESSGPLGPVAFFKDHDGVVHMKGMALSGAGPIIFNLPPGFRPALNKTIFPVVRCQPCSSFVGFLNISGETPTEAFNSGAVYAPTGASLVSLDGVTFRAES